MHRPRITIGRLMVVVAASAIYCAVARSDSSCSQFAPIVLVLYGCAILGSYAARWRGRRWQTGFWLGLLLGPIGLIAAASNPVPTGWPESSRAGRESLGDPRPRPTDAL